MDTVIQQEINRIKENPQIKDALDLFDRAQKTYEQAMDATTLKQAQKYRGTYSSSLSEKEYYANISTTTR